MTVIHGEVSTRPLPFGRALSARGRRPSRHPASGFAPPPTVPTAADARIRQKRSSPRPRFRRLRGTATASSRVCAGWQMHPTISADTNRYEGDDPFTG